MIVKDELLLKFTHQSTHPKSLNVINLETHPLKRLLKKNEDTLVGPNLIRPADIDQ